MTQSLQAIQYDAKLHKLRILDQLRLPNESIYVPIETTEDAYKAIKDMVVRGAPAIAIVAMLAVSIDLHHKRSQLKDLDQVRDWTEQKLDYIIKSRRTAVNLSKAVEEFKKTLREHVPANELIDKIIKKAQQMLEDDVNDNKNIGKNGTNWIIEQLELKPSEKISVLTICNTGSLATAGYGTALGVIRALHQQDRLSQAYHLETRPYNQGSRLTSYELVHDKIPATLVMDSMASALLKAHPEIKLVVVGADRVAKNGDTANKIGTYQLAVTTRYHGRKFVVAAPTTSIDFNIKTGDEIVIEQRAANEATQFKGNIIRDGEVDPLVTATVSTAAPRVNVWNPAFDVTPECLIDAIVTEKQVFTKTGLGFSLNDD